MENQGAVFEVCPGALGKGTTGGYVEVGNAQVAILDVPWIVGMVGWRVGHTNNPPAQMSQCHSETGKNMSQLGCIISKNLVGLQSLKKLITPPSNLITFH